MRIARASIALVAASLGSPALAADATTVQSLLSQGYELVGTVPSQIGPGLFLQLDENLYPVSLLRFGVAELARPEDALLQAGALIPASA